MRNERSFIVAAEVNIPRSQIISFCRSCDGTRIAVASVGGGPPILRAAHWLSHVDYDLQSPVWRPWLEALSRRNRYVRYDLRGCGLSDQEVDDISFDVWLADMEAVADTIDEERFAILGMSQGGALAIAYALRHPERVSHLVLYGAYAQGARIRANDSDEALEAETLLNLIRLGWGRDNAAFRQVFTNLFIPEGTPQQHAWWSDLERITATPEIAARTLKELQRIDVAGLAPQLTVPTLVMHSRDDARVPFEEGRRLAALIPNARFVALESANHVLLPDEPAWRRFQAELSGFLHPQAQDAPAPVLESAGLTPAETIVLQLVAEGMDNRAIAQRLGKSEKTVRNQVSSVLEKMGARTRAQAIVAALRAGMGQTPQD